MHIEIAAANGIEDPIVAEVRRVRDEHAAQYGYDLQRIYEALKERERRSRRKLVSYPPRRLVDEPVR